MVHDVTSENGSKGFKSEYKKGPSGRTIRRRLENVEFRKLRKLLNLWHEEER